MKILWLFSPVPGSVGAVVISLEADWRDSIGWDPELLECERREVCHGTVLALTHVLGWPRSQVWPHSLSPPLLSCSNLAILHSQLRYFLKLKLLDNLEGRDWGETVCI